jgi:hypothetical protein
MKPLVTLALALVLFAPGEVPPQNQEKGERPGPASAVEGAASLLRAVAADDPSLAHAFFFPADAFDLVKDLPVPGNYHRKLLSSYDEDIRAVHQRFRGGTWRVDELRFGTCKWKEPGSEGNKLPYWSCYRNLLVARDGEHTRRLEIQALINWGDRWYVTHLGPVRK